MKNFSKLQVTNRGTNCRMTDMSNVHTCAASVWI
jgi:hypothetical protein